MRPSSVRAGQCRAYVTNRRPWRKPNRLLRTPGRRDDRRARGRLEEHHANLRQRLETRVGADGEVIGSTELSWLVQRVAVLLPEQEGRRKKLEAADWTCFSILPGGALGVEEFGVLCELVGQGAE
jgi:hypothetical protein